MEHRSDQDGYRCVPSLPHTAFHTPLDTFPHTTGVLTIFVWRIAAKSFCLSILPPIFRFLSHLVTLPHRRFYTPATDYTSVPPEKGLRPIPSVIDLPRMVEYEANAASTARAGAGGGYGTITMKQRSGRGAGVQGSSAPGEDEKSGAAKEWSEPRGKRARDDVKHYDADGACAHTILGWVFEADAETIWGLVLQC